MSALARYFNSKGYLVSGYDRCPSDITDALAKEGIAVHFEADLKAIPPCDQCLVIYTPAIPADFPELKAVREGGYRLVKRALALGEVTKGQRCLAVSGTHGKTTTSTLLAHILTVAGKGCSAFMGGLSKNYSTNLLIGKEPVIVVEADEFDRSFHQLWPENAIITSMDADHLDIYGTHANLIEAFRVFASQVGGAVLVKKGLEDEIRPTAKAKLYTYSLDDSSADFHASDIELREQGRLYFTLNSPYGNVSDCHLGVIGRHNIENAVAASALALMEGVGFDKLKEALASFQGVTHRLDLLVSKDDFVYIHDYAHHPVELSRSIQAIREAYPGRKITAVFQPHLYTRTRDFNDEFASALSQVDSLIMLPIYPARELPIPGVCSENILEKSQCPEKTMSDKAGVLEAIQKSKPEVLVTFGAGDISNLTEPIRENYR